VGEFVERDTDAREIKRLLDRILTGVFLFFSPKSGQDFGVRGDNTTKSYYFSVEMVVGEKQG
jgi:hypothetical protein